MARTQSQQASFYIDVPPLASIAVKRKVKALPQPDRFRPLPTSNVVVEIPPSPWKTAHARAKQLNQNAAPVLLRPSTNMSTMTSTDRPRPLKEKNSMDTVISHFDEPGKPQDLKKRKMEVVENETDRKKQRVQLSKAISVTKTIINPSLGVNALNVETAPKPIVKRPRKVVVPEAPVWVPIPHTGTRAATEDRIFLREFFHRFSTILKFSKANRDALDEFTVLSPQVTKAMLISLIDLLMADAKEELAESLRVAKTALRKGGPDADQLWSTLAALRESAPDLTIADPLPANPSIRDALNIETTSQLIPTIISLAEIALQGPSIHDDISEGLEACRKARLQSDECTKVEKDRWAQEKAKLTTRRDDGSEREKQALAALKEGEKMDGDDVFDLKAWKTQYKEVEGTHKTKLQSIRMRLLQKTTCEQLRFISAGTDMDGRVYYILSLPAQGVKLPSDEVRAGMGRWSWFVAVHGTPGAETTADATTNAWYGFNEAKEIRKLSKWLTWRTTGARLTLSQGAETGAVSAATSLMSRSVEGDAERHEITTPSTLPRSAVKAMPTKLGKSLDDFADFLDWMHSRRKDC